MPNPAEVATITTAAGTYSYWKSISIERTVGETVSHEVSLNDLKICEALITVPGWLMDDGTLWINHLREEITINSPMLVPKNPFTLLLRGVKHRQSSEEGTTTELDLCIPRGIGSGLMVDIGNAPPGT